MNTGYCSVNDWLLDSATGSILHLKTGERKRLGEYQLKLLEVLAQHAGSILTREELTQWVWERRVIGSNSLPNAIHALRAALEDDGKQQKIIKTIPKKGYILEQEYCLFVEPQELQPAQVPPADIPPPPDAQPAEAAPRSHLCILPQAVPLSATENTPLAAPSRQKRPARRRWLALLLLPLLAVMAVGYPYIANNPQLFSIKTQEKDVYSNIHLYQLLSTGNTFMVSDTLHNKLKETFYRLNQQLASRHIQMKIYYQVSDQVLNYTFSTDSLCQRKRLAMTIYHWRLDPQQLNNLIYRETERKLDEMSTCTH